MTNLRKLSIGILGLLLPLMWTATGCVREDFSGCKTSFKFTVKAYDADKVTELDNSSVEDVVLYIFDRNDCFVQEVTTSVGTTIEVSSPRGEVLKVVAWGNLGGGNQSRPALKVGDHITKGAVELLALSHAGTNSQIPDDLFTGITTLVKSQGSDVQIVPIYRKTGKVSITIQGLRQYFGITDDDVSVVVNTTCGVIPFSGGSPQGEVSYRPEGAFTSGDEFIVEPFNIFAANGITIDIFHGETLLARVSTIDGTNPIDVSEGITTNILVSFRSSGSVDVNVSLTPWEEYELWKGYN